HPAVSVVDVDERAVIVVEARTVSGLRTRVVAFRLVALEVWRVERSRRTPVFVEPVVAGVDPGAAADDVVLPPVRSSREATTHGSQLSERSERNLHVDAVDERDVRPPAVVHTDDPFEGCVLQPLNRAEAVGQVALDRPVLEAITLARTRSRV